MAFKLTFAQEEKLRKLCERKEDNGITIVGIDYDSLLISGPATYENRIRMISPDGRIRKASDVAKLTVWKRRKALRERTIRKQNT